MGREGQPKALLGLNRDRLLFRGPTGLRIDGSVNNVNFLESIIDSMVDRLDEKRGDFYRLRIGRGFAGCGCLPYPGRNT